MKDLASKELQEDRTVKRVAEVEGIRLQSLGWGRDADTRVSLLFPYICAGLTVTSVMGLMETNMHKLLAIGRTSSRKRQNRALCLALRLGLDWCVAAEWYGCVGSIKMRGVSGETGVSNLMKVHMGP